MGGLLSGALLSSRVAVGIRWALLGKGLSILGFVAVAAILARVVSPGTLGSYFLVVGAIGALALLVGLGLNQIGLADIARADAEGDAEMARRTVLYVLFVVSGSSAVAGVALSVSAVQDGLSGLLNSPDIGEAGPALGVMMVLYVLNAQVVQLLRGLKAFRVSESLAGLSGNALLAIMLVPAMVAGSTPSLSLILIFNSIALAAPLALGLVVLIRRMGGWRGRARIRGPVSATRPGSFHRAWPVVIHSLCLYSARQADLWLVAMMYGPANAGIYAAASRVSNILSHPLSIVNGIVAPYVAGVGRSPGGAGKLRDILVVTGAVAAVPTLVLAALMCLEPSGLLDVLFGPGYAAGYSVLLILTVGQAVNALSGSCGIALLMSHQGRVLAFISAASLALSVIAGWTLGQSMGLMGIALGFAGGVAVQNLSMWWAARSRMGLLTHFRPFAAWRVVRGMRAGGE